jgi:hypothetical protein
MFNKDSALSRTGTVITGSSINVTVKTLLCVMWLGSELFSTSNEHNLTFTEFT